MRLHMLLMLMCASRSSEAFEPINGTELYDAVQLWKVSPTAAVAANGNISDWDTSNVMDMKFVCGALLRAVVDLCNRICVQGRAS